MSTQALETCAPANSLIARQLPGAYFHDAWSVEAADPSLSALGQFRKALSHTPAWVNSCMALRNRVVSLLGLKDLGALDNLDSSKSDADYRPGDRVGIFTLIDNRFGEVLLGDQDKHLNVTLSVHRTPESPSGKVIVTVTTVVHVNNLLGRAYMLPVKPMHRLIAPAVLKAIAKTGSGPSQG
ncbi:DUF2867 domain-containing protein [Neisseriaceae bacterium JH1-16]|nr:DUF2867 domain-containing protein [Neisseriaceae bacterium JH1-16]